MDRNVKEAVDVLFFEASSAEVCACERYYGEGISMNELSVDQQECVGKQAIEKKY